MGEVTVFWFVFIFCFVSKAISTPKGVIYNTTFAHSETKKRTEKCLTFSRPIIYYSNTTARQRSILSGDIETNPDQQRRAILQNIAINLLLLLLLTAVKKCTFQC